jgi:hypothetical protein
MCAGPAVLSTNSIIPRPFEGSALSHQPISRRVLLCCAAGTLSGLALGKATAQPAAAPLLDPAASDAQKLKYVEDASQASGATRGASCANCSLYQGKTGAAAGPCQVFPGKWVKAAGWCTSWAPQM